MSNSRISVVIPVYNNKASLEETCFALDSVRVSKFPAIALDIILVDDGSTDGSWAEIERLSQVYEGSIRGLRLSRNFGQVSAIQAGLQASVGDATVIVSADLQDPLHLVAEMVEAWEEGSEVVLAHRVNREDGFGAKTLSKIAYSVARSAYPGMPPGGFDFLLLSRRAVNILTQFSGHHRFFQGDVLWLGLPTRLLPYERVARRHGKSAWTLRRRFKYFTDVVLDSTTTPLRFMSRIGILVAFCGVAYAIVVLASWWANQTPFSGYAPIMITLLVLGGLILSTLGLTGEYLWRMFDDLKMRPNFIVQDVSSHREQSEQEHPPQ